MTLDTTISLNRCYTKEHKNILKIITWIQPRLADLLTATILSFKCVLRHSAQKIKYVF
jgi:hypothetical protein